jgi:hypothetical protein
MVITQIDSQTGLTAAFVGAGIAISSYTGDWTIALNIQAIVDASATPTVRFEFDDSVNSFTGYLCGPTFSAQGAIVSSNDIVKRWRSYDFPDMRFGVSNALLRLQLTNITSGASVSYRAWVEH